MGRGQDTNSTQESIKIKAPCTIGNSNTAKALRMHDELSPTENERIHRVQAGWLLFRVGMTTRF
jgi:hypothetical protein